MKTFNGERKGFVLYLVVAMLMGLAILAFALSSFKSGSVRMLSKNIDQNRLTLLAQSANEEMITNLRTQCNVISKDKNTVAGKFRQIMSDLQDQANGFIKEKEYVLFDSWEPKVTKAMADHEGYDIDIKTRVVLTYFREAPYYSIQSYLGYLDITSQAKNIFAGSEVSVEVQERRDVRLIDLRHYFDKYALFVKCHSQDYNDPHRRIVIKGIHKENDPENNNSPDVSRVYLGSKYPPNCSDPEKEHIWLDLDYDYVSDLPGFQETFKGKTELKAMKFGYNIGLNTDSDPVLWGINQKKVADFTVDNAKAFKLKFAKVKQLQTWYEQFITNMAKAAHDIRDKKAEPQFLRGTKLATYCDSGLQHLYDKGLNSSNSAVIKLLENFMAKADHSDNNPDPYSNEDLISFQQLLSECFRHWVYMYGYTDAKSLWNLDSINDYRGSYPVNQGWIGRGPKDSPVMGGINFRSDLNGGKGPYIYAYDDGNNAFNSSRASVGRMMSLYGEGDKKIRLLVEGKVFLRFFKVAYLDSMVSDGIDFGVNDTVNIQIVPIPLDAIKKDDSSGKFLNYKLGTEFSEKPKVFSDKRMMSRAIDQIPINALWGGKDFKYYNESGEVESFNPLLKIDKGNDRNPVGEEETNNSVDSATFYSKALGIAPAYGFARLIDEQSETYNYEKPSTFLAQRVMDFETKSGTKRTLFVDGLMFIKKGDLDLTDINYFYGNGMIFVLEGDCKISNMAKTKNEDTLRIYLAHGDFDIVNKNGKNRIEASLAALYPESETQANLSRLGELKINGQSEVYIKGNLILDRITTANLQNPGKLVIEHDDEIYDPTDPYHVTIGPVRSSFSMNAGKPTLGKK